MACSPGGRFSTLTSIFIPEADSEIEAVPTALPWASFSCTSILFFVLAELTDIRAMMKRARENKRIIFMQGIIQRKEAAGFGLQAPRLAPKKRVFCPVTSFTECIDFSFTLPSAVKCTAVMY